MKIKVLPSIMCCRVEEYKPYIELFEKVGLDAIHFDVMDGTYVPNLMLGTSIYKDVKRLSKLPVDLHLMVVHPERVIPAFQVQPGDRICFHPETTQQPYKLLQSIRDMGCRAGLVLNPGTPIGYVEECAAMLDYVLVMTVNPGFSGQKMVPDAPEKIRRVRALMDRCGLGEADLEVDGNTTPENSARMLRSGANAFVGGTASVIKELADFERNYHSYYTHLCSIAAQL